MHRHFASRTALLHAVCHDRVATLAAQAVAPSHESDAGQALVTWLRALGAYASTTRGLPQSMLQSAVVTAISLASERAPADTDADRLLLLALDGVRR